MLKTMKIQILVLMMALSTLTFGQKTITLQVKENTVPCEGVAPMDCMQVKEGNANTWSNFYSSIQGFNYQPGYLYKLSVLKTKRTGNIPADASAYTYKLKKVISKKKVQVPNTAYLNKKMVLTRINGKAVTGDKVYMTLDNARNSISGKSGCNRFNAGYKLSGNTIEVNPLMGTMMACDPKSMKLEQEFMAAMGDKKFELHSQGNTIHFKAPKTKTTVLTFQIPAENEIWSFIDGKKWKLIQMDHTGQDYGKAMIQFDVTTKKVSGNSGCNNFFGSFTTKGDEISFAALGGTKMACLDKSAADTEKKMLNHLSNTSLRFDVAEQTLNFYKGDKLIMMFGMVR